MFIFPIGLSLVEVESSTSMPSTTHGSLSTPPLDPADWPTVINDKVYIDLVSRGPAHVDHHFTFPKRQSDNIRFHYHNMFRSLTNGERVRRSWLTYSQKNNVVTVFVVNCFQKKQQSSVQMVNKTGSILAHYLSNMKTAQIMLKICCLGRS